MKNASSTTIFTDGSSRGNPGPGGWGTVVIENERVVEAGRHEDATTNNRMEIKAAVEGLRLGGSQKVIVYTDSSYLINGATKWVWGWQKNGWKTSTKEDVSNQDLWQELVAELQRIVGDSKREIVWEYVGGHIGIAGNERCDVIATSFADSAPVELFSGMLSDYSVKDILNVEKNKSESNGASEEKSAAKKRSNSKAYSYVSFVDGTLQTHVSWAECEKRVKGVRGARFKKCLWPDDEKNVIAEFTQK